MWRFLISLEQKCWSLMRRLIQQKVYMKKPLSSIVILTLLLTKPGGTVMDKASVLEVFRYKSPWSLDDLVSLFYRTTKMAMNNEKDHNMVMLKV